MPTDRPSILWLHSDKFGCGTYRCYTPALTLEEQGFDNNFLPHHECTEGFAWLDDIDIVVFQRAVGTLFLDAMAECHKRGIVTVFETDDDLFHIEKRNPSAPFWHRPAIQRLLVQQLHLADHIVTSTFPLKSSVIDAIGCAASKVSVCYNHLRSEMWGPAVTGTAVQPRFRNVQTIEDREAPYTAIGWQGSNTHDADFRQVLPALSRIIAERDDVIMRFFGNVPLTVRGHIPESRFQWSRGVDFEFYPSQLAYMNFDIGLAPITDSKFNQAKSNLKWLEYSSIGVPTVASRVYPYATSIEHGVTGIVCRTDNDWYEALTTLIDNPAERQAMGQRAQAHVWEQWSTTRAQKWVDLFTALLRQHHGKQLLPQLARSPGDASELASLNNFLAASHVDPAAR